MTTLKRTFGTLIIALLLSVLATQSAFAQTKLPTRALGYWYDSQDARWSYGFFENFAIHDSQFWDYGSIIELRGNTQITLINGDRQINLSLKFDPRSDTLATINLAKSKLQRLTRHTVAPRYTAPDHTPFADNGYHLDSAHIEGCIAGVAPGQQIELSIQNIVSQESETFTSTLDSLGRFSISLPTVNTNMVVLSLPKSRIYNIYSVIEAGERLILHYNHATSRIHFMGRNARVHREIEAYRNHPPIKAWDKHISYDEQCDHQTYAAKCRAIHDEQINILINYIKNTPQLSARFASLMRSNAAMNYASSLMQRRFALRANFNPEYFTQEYMQTADSLFRLTPLTLTLDFLTTSFLSDYLDYYARKNSCAVSSGSVDILMHLDRQGTHPLTDTDRQALNALNQYLSITILGLDAGAEQHLIDSLAKPYLAGAEHAKRLMADTTVLRVITEYESLEDEVREAKHFDQQLAYFENTPIIAPIIKEWAAATAYYTRLNELRRPLSDRAMKRFDTLVHTDFFRREVLDMQARYEQVERSEVQHKASLRSNDSLTETSDAVKLFEQLTAPYRGKVIMIDFWGTWCSPCKSEMAQMPPIFKQMEGKDVVFMYLANNSPRESWVNVIKELSSSGSNVVHYNLPPDQQKLIERHFSISVFPSYLFVDRTGRVLDLAPAHPNALIKQLNDLIDTK